MQAQINANVHNRFDVEVVDSRTGKVRQRARGFNIVLDNMWTTLCNGQAFFTNIAFGQGTGTLDPARTSLFSQIASLNATVVDTVKALPTSYVKKSITLPLGTYAGKTISEVGVYGSRLNTHALLEDSEGQPISIAVGEFDIVTIYATVYSTFAIENSDDMTLIGMPDNNSLVNYLTGTGSAPAGGFSVGEGDGDGNPYMSGCESYPVLGSTSSVTWTADVANRKRVSSSARLATASGNGHIMEVAFSNLFRARLPITGTFEGQLYQGVPLGTGDGVTKTFVLPSRNVLQDSIGVKIDGVLTEAYTKEQICSSMFAWRSLVLDVIADTVAISDDAEVVALQIRGSPHVYVWRKWSPMPLSGVIESTGELYSGAGLALTPDGKVLAVGTDSGSRIFVFDWTGSVWQMRPAPAVLPSGTVWGVALTPDGNTMAVAHNLGDYVSVYDWTAEAWVKRPSPSSKPANNGRRVALSADGNTMAVTALDYRLSIYTWAAGAWTRQGNFGLSAVGLGLCVSPDGKTVAVAQGASPGLTLYDLVAGTWTARQGPTHLPGNAKGLAMTSDTTVIAVAQGASPGLTLYDLKLRDTKIIFNSAPSNGVAITADYTTKGLHKTDQYVVDLACAIQFGEPAV